MGCCGCGGTKDDDKEDDEMGARGARGSHPAGSAPLLKEEIGGETRRLPGRQIVTRNSGKVNMNEQMAHSDGRYVPCAFSRTTGQLPDLSRIHGPETPPDRVLTKSNSTYRDRKPPGLTDIDARYVHLNRKSPKRPNSMPPVG